MAKTTAPSETAPPVRPRATIGRIVHFHYAVDGDPEAPPRTVAAAAIVTCVHGETVDLEVFLPPHGVPAGVTRQQTGVRLVDEPEAGACTWPPRA